MLSHHAFSPLLIDCNWKVFKGCHHPRMIQPSAGRMSCDFTSVVQESTFSSAHLPTTSADQTPGCASSCCQLPALPANSAHPPTTLLPSSPSPSLSLLASMPHGSAPASAHGTCRPLIGRGAAVLFSDWSRRPRPRPWRWWGLAWLGLDYMQANLSKRAQTSKHRQTNTGKNKHNQQDLKQAKVLQQGHILSGPHTLVWTTKNIKMTGETPEVRSDKYYPAGVLRRRLLHRNGNFVGENCFLAKIRSWPGRLWTNPKSSNR